LLGSAGFRRPCPPRKGPSDRIADLHALALRMRLRARSALTGLAGPVSLIAQSLRTDNLQPCDKFPAPRLSHPGIPCSDGKRADASKGRAIGAPASQAQAAQNRCACCTILKGAPWPMVSARDTFRPRTRDMKVMFAVTYGDGRSAYIRVDPETARHGNLVVMDIARERQEAGEIPGGTILSVKQVR